MLFTVTQTPNNNNEKKTLLNCKMLRKYQSMTKIHKKKLHALTLLFIQSHPRGIWIKISSNRHQLQYLKNTYILLHTYNVKRKKNQTHIQIPKHIVNKIALFAFNIFSYSKRQTCIEPLEPDQRIGNK